MPRPSELFSVCLILLGLAVLIGFFFRTSHARIRVIAKRLGRNDRSTLTRLRATLLPVPQPAPLSSRLVGQNHL